MSNENAKVIGVEELYERAKEWLQGAGRRVDPRKAQRLFAIAARAGHPESQYLLGMLLRTRQGGKQDSGEAAVWLRRAAEQGHPQAQYEVGGLYRTGDGLRQNRVLSLKWCILAGVSGDSDADVQCALVAQGLSDKQQKRAMRLALRWKFRRDVNQVTEELLEEAGPLPFQEETGREVEKEDDLPCFVRLTPPVP